jgi:hypothetical protein
MEVINKENKKIHSRDAGQVYSHLHKKIFEMSRWLINKKFIINKKNVFNYDREVGKK